MDASTISSGSTERLQEMVNSTTMKLNTIWDEVGDLLQPNYFV